MTLLWIGCLVAAVWMTIGAIMAVGKAADEREAERGRKDRR